VVIGIVSSDFPAGVLSACPASPLLFQFSSGHSLVSEL
jgi:hypothetical protein